MRAFLMSYLEAIIFGLVQGISEFLPISSTAHLIMTERLLGYSFPGLTFEIFLHLASILGVIIYFRRDIAVILKGSYLFLIGGNRRDEDRVQFRFLLLLFS